MTSPPSRSGRGLGDGTLVLRDVEVAGERVDVRIVDGTIEQIGEAVRTRTSDEVVAGAGGALLPRDKIFRKGGGAKNLEWLSSSGILPLKKKSSL